MGLLFLQGLGDWTSWWSYWYSSQAPISWLATMVCFLPCLCQICLIIYMVNAWDTRCRGMKQRDLLLRRYWRREDDGTYGDIVGSTQVVNTTNGLLNWKITFICFYFLQLFFTIQSSTKNVHLKRAMSVPA